MVKEVLKLGKLVKGPNKRYGFMYQYYLDLERFDALDLLDKESKEALNILRDRYSLTFMDEAKMSISARKMEEEFREKELLHHMLSKNYSIDRAKRSLKRMKMYGIDPYNKFLLLDKKKSLETRTPLLSTTIFTILDRLDKRVIRVRFQALEDKLSWSGELEPKQRKEYLFLKLKLQNNKEILRDKIKDIDS